ncbi:MAG: hypothetical protein E7352_00655 [Clostridiales bacterium]|nr:hypothetical protein [Clostridiales bacterium]
MTLNLLAGAADKTREFSNVGEAALYALLGFLVVFCGIAFLIFVVWIVGKIMSQATGKTVKKQPKEKVKEAQPTPKIDNDEIDDETVAVITAAIMAYYQQNNPKCEFTVKRIKRI